MIIAIIGIIIGLLVAGAGIYFLKEDKDNAESKKIYTIISVIGFVITAAAAVILVLNLR